MRSARRKALLKAHREALRRERIHEQFLAGRQANRNWDGRADYEAAVLRGGPTQVELYLEAHQRQAQMDLRMYKDRIAFRAAQEAEEAEYEQSLLEIDDPDDSDQSDEPDQRGPRRHHYYEGPVQRDGEPMEHYEARRRLCSETLSGWDRQLGEARVDDLLERLASDSDIETKKAAVKAYMGWLEFSFLVPTKTGVLKACPLRQGWVDLEIGHEGGQPTDLYSYRRLTNHPIWKTYQAELEAAREARKAPKQAAHEKAKRAFRWLMENINDGNPVQIEKRLQVLGLTLTQWRDPLGHFKSVARNLTQVEYAACCELLETDKFRSKKREALKAALVWWLASNREGRPFTEREWTLLLVAGSSPACEEG